MIKFKLVVFFLVISLLSACSSGSERKNEITFFNKITFPLRAKERVIDLKPSITKDYESMFTTETGLAAPLFRYVEHPDYRIFLAIPYNTTFAQLKENRYLKNAELQEEKSTNTYHFRAYRTEKREILHELIKLEENNIIYLLAQTQHPAVADSVLGHEVLSKRIQRNE